MVFVFYKLFLGEVVLFFYELCASAFIIQIPGMKEKYKSHLDVNTVKKYGALRSLKKQGF